MVLFRAVLRGDVEAHQKIRSQYQEEEEEDKESGRTGGKKKVINKTTRQKLETLANREAEFDLQGQFTQGSFQWV